VFVLHIGSSPLGRSVKATPIGACGPSLPVIANSDRSGNAAGLRCPTNPIKAEMEPASTRADEGNYDLVGNNTPVFLIRECRDSA
jgi:Catalase